jgi:hypothetical protein
MRCQIGVVGKAPAKAPYIGERRLLECGSLLLLYTVYTSVHMLAIASYSVVVFRSSSTVQTTTFSHLHTVVLFTFRAGLDHAPAMICLIAFRILETLRWMVSAET